jgi:4-hydroxy-tetrahydrodipicolinate synthase
MELPHLHGLVPPIPTPLLADGSIDVEGLARLVDIHIKAGMHGLWVLGTTGRFDLQTDASWRTVAETAVEAAQGRVPLVLNVSDMGTERTVARAKMGDDLPYDYYAALPPWYLPMTPPEVIDYYHALADRLARPLVIYNAPWICNQLSFANLRKLAEHPRIVGCKDVTPSLSRPQDWSVSERRKHNFSYLHGTDQIASATELGSDGFVSALSNAFPELAVAIWDAIRVDDFDRAFRLQSQFLRLARALEFGPAHACLEAICKHRGLLKRMLPLPLRPLDPETARKVVALVEEVGAVPSLDLVA